MSQSVLIADDNPNVAGRLEALLTEHNMTVVGPASDGIEALELYRLHKPQSVVLDFQMPGRNGLEVLEEIRRDSSDCHVIILTSGTEASVRERCIQAGANLFLNKARDMDRLVDALKSRILEDA